MQFKDKTIWITGASSGIGEALAYGWAKYKCKLILSSRNKEKLEKVKEKCIALGSECIIAEIDLEDEKQVVKSATEVLKIYPTIDILVNNGGISQRSMVAETPLKVDRKIMETNFFGTINLTKQVLPAMIKAKSGNIVVISSIVGKFGFPLRSAYSASKHALQGYFDSLRAEYFKDNIRVTIVSPGRILTNISINAVDKDGKKHGIMDDGQADGMPADICAKKIISAVSKNKKDILVGRSELLMAYFRKFIPPLYYRLARNINPT